MRFLHLADVHLDTPFAGRSEALRNRLREASRQAFGRAVDETLAADVDAVLIAGDLFDGSRLSFATERFLLGELGRLGAAGIQVVYATGNHDPGRSATTERSSSWPHQVTVIGRREPQRVAIRRDGAIVGFVTAAGHERHRETLDLASAFPRPPGVLPEVGLLHTQVHAARSAEEHHAYAPSSLETLRKGGFDYWALGHVHTRQGLSTSPPIHYPGNVQGRTPREQGPRGGLLVDLRDRDDPRIEFRAFAPVRWETIEVGDLEEARTLDGLVRRVRQVWDEARADDSAEVDEWIIRVVLRGPSPLWRELGDEDERRIVADELAGDLGALDVTVETAGLHPVVSIDEHRRREDVLGEALRLVAAVRADAGTIPLTVDDLAGFEADRSDDVNAYVRSLLRGAEGEIVARLLRTED
jgi:exonuclease SbcD